MSMSNSQEVLTSSSGTKKRSRVRIVILLLLSVGTMINYLDRTILGIVAPQLTQEIHIDPAMMGIIFSAFAWTYALAQIPGGMFLDRFGNKLTYALSIFFWSLFTLLQSFTLGLKSLLLLRLGLGVSEAPCFPANSRIVSTWFPQHERARATATYTVGEYIGLAAFSPLLFLILEHHGWRTLFFLTGGLGILFTLVWWRFYHEPHESRTANQAELDYIGANGINNKIQNVPFNWRDARRLLGCRQILGASLHAGVFPDVVSQLSGQRAPSSLAARWLLRHLAVSRRRHRHPLRRLDLGPTAEANRLRQYQSEVTNNFRIITLQLYYCGELGERQQHRYYYYVSGIFWSGNGWSGLDVNF